MLGTFKPVAFDPYGRRTRRRVPRWLILLLTGVAAGAAGVIVVQEKYLPPRLSHGESTKLRADFDQADADRKRLAAELSGTSKKLDATLAENKSLADALAGSRRATESLKQDVSSLVAALPPDPRGGTVEVRAGRFSVEGNQLAYDVVVSRPRAGAKPLTGVMQLALTGDSAGKADTTVNLPSVPLSVSSHETLRGSLKLPEGFRPKTATVSLLDREGGSLLGRRVLYVK